MGKLSGPQHEEAVPAAPDMMGPTGLLGLCVGLSRSAPFERLVETVPPLSYNRIKLSTLRALPVLSSSTHFNSEYTRVPSTQ